MVQIFLLMPLLVVLAWRLRGHTQARLLLIGVLVLTGALVLCAWLELWLIESALADLVNMKDRARQLATLRWGEVTIAAAAATALRLGYVARSF